MRIVADDDHETSNTTKVKSDDVSSKEDSKDDGDSDSQKEEDEKNDDDDDDEKEDKHHASDKDKSDKTDKKADVETDDEADDEQESQADEDEFTQQEKVVLARLQRNISQLEDEIDFNLEQQATSKAKLVEISDISASQKEIHGDVSDVVNETSSPALGHVLGSMWEEMRKYARPFFKEHLAEKIEELKKEELVLRQQLKEARNKLRLKKEQLSKAKKGAEIKAVTKTDTKKVKGEHEALYTERTMPSISATVKCIIILSVQYFLIYTALAVLRTMTQYSSSAALKRAKEAVEPMCCSITFAPALSVLFLATRMRAILLTKGETEKYQLPQPWVRYMMFACTFALPLQALVVLVRSLYAPTPKKEEVGDADPQPLEPTPPPAGRMNRGQSIVLNVVYYVSLVLLYGGFTAVCLGSLLMEAPKQLWHGKQMPVSMALSCTLALTSIFFAVYLHGCCYSAASLNMSYMRRRML